MNSAESGRTAATILVGTQELTMAQAYQVALQLQEGGDLSEAEGIYRQILALDPDHADSYHRLGLLACEIGLNEVAVHLGERALELDPQLIEAHNNLGNALQELGHLDSAIACYRRALAVSPEFAKAHCNLGNALQRQNRFPEAIAAYRQALHLKPNYAEAHNNLGFLYMGLGRDDEARAEFLLALACKPDLGAATHMLAVLGGKNTAGAPAEYVKGLFDHYSLNFERHLREELQYDVPRLVYEKFAELGLSNGRRFRHTLDLGCGTGLAGELFRPLSVELSGVDLSEKMLLLAREKKIYDRLLVADMRHFLQGGEERYDLFLAFDCFIYLGELESIFAAITAHAHPGAYFAFSTESLVGDGFLLQPSTRYAHGRGYIENLARRLGWRILLGEAVDLRKDKWGWIAGEIYILRLEAEGEADRA